jgi:hypothetical protein
MKKRWLASAGAPLLAILLGGESGCQGGGAEGGCPATQSCGGDPTGTWVVDHACQYLPEQLDQPLALSQYQEALLDPTLAPTPAQPSTNGDWCLGFNSTAANVIQVANLFHDAPAFQSGTVTFSPAANGRPQEYSAALLFATQGTTHFTRVCLEATGANPTCPVLAQSLTTFVNSAPPLPAGATSAYSAPIVNGAPARTGIACQDASDLGCDCFYTYQVEVTDTGTWSAAALNGDTVIIEESQHYAYNKAAVQEYAPATPMTATYCAIKGSQLTLTGYQGSSLSSAVGLRTLIMHPAP